jgi:hypothetical protein
VRLARSYLGLLVVIGIVVGVVIGYVALNLSSRVPRHDVLRTDVPELVRPPRIDLGLVNGSARRALRYWHGTRCSGSISDRYSRSLPNSRVAQADWSYLDSAPASYIRCSVTLNIRLRLPRYVYCAAIVHEYGHLAGFFEPGGPDGGIHSRHPTNVMYRVLTQRNIPASCRGI